MKIDQVCKEAYEILKKNGLTEDQLKKEYPIEKMKKDLEIGVSNGYSLEQQLGIFKLIGMMGGGFN